jgi:hypothetical protein
MKPLKKLFDEFPRKTNMKIFFLMHHSTWYDGWNYFLDNTERRVVNIIFNHFHENLDLYNNRRRY